MPFILRNRIAVALLLGVFLIPLVLSSLRGITHIFTCAEPVMTSFNVNLDGDVPVILSATQITADGDELLCGGIDIDIAAVAGEERQVGLTFTIDNTTDRPWYGTLSLDLDDPSVLQPLDIPIAVGRIEAGASQTEAVTLRLREGTHEFDGVLLVGP